MQAEAAFGSLNLNGAPASVVMRTIRDGTAFMAAQPEALEGCGGLVIGIAGVSNRNAASMIESAVRECGYSGPLRLAGDQEIALAGAVRGHGAVLISGTGSVCYGRDRNGASFRTGGYGYLIDDEGSGYAVGRDILRAVVRAADGRGKQTCLTELVYDALKVSDVSGIITWLYAPDTGKKGVASLAPLLLIALAQTDPAAKEIAERAAEELCLMVTAAWEKAGMKDGELACTGSILTRYPAIREALAQRLHATLPELRITEAQGSPAKGAAMLARSLQSSSPS